MYEITWFWRHYINRRAYRIRACLGHWLTGGLVIEMQSAILRQLVSVSDTHSQQCKELVRSQERRLAASDRQVCHPPPPLPRANLKASLYKSFTALIGCSAPPGFRRSLT